MSYVDHIVRTFGGVRAMARKTGFPVSTVASWRTRGSIPDAAKPVVLQMANDLGGGLTHTDFFPSLPGRFDQGEADQETIRGIVSPPNADPEDAA